MPWKCDTSCMKPRPKQNAVRRVCVQAYFAPLVGFFQTVPRAELTAILIAIRHGKSPQTIVCDHKNHVDATTFCIMTGVDVKF